MDHDEEPFDYEPKISIAGAINVSATSDAVFTARGLSLAIEDTLLIDDASFVLLKGHRYGLVGENGAPISFSICNRTFPILCPIAFRDAFYIF
jgi:hypothetical protein